MPAQTTAPKPGASAGATAAANQQAVAGESHARIVEHEGEAAVRMARSRADLEITFAEADTIAVREVAIGTFRAAGGGKHDGASELAS